ncbi:DUF418 domain-containing protein [Flammeovirgaceae bacterium KN852]|uniref:DUF418 domain-containing protein n=2 Tax=Marinigracilibium pacificum TaxID=2729599 RepID=A0A848IX77_9BACT|nr:DUF418 domain-containing protein [Marinigracilibium pacificum]
MRGCVLLGILIMNINGMGLAGAYGNPTVAGGAEGVDLYTWITANMFFEGTMRALFSLLFGVGMFIFMDRLEKKGVGLIAANIYFRRIIWLLIFGLIHAYILLWEGEILYNYAIMGFLVYSFRKLAPKKLIIGALILFLGGAFWNFQDYQDKVEFMESVNTAIEYKESGKELTRQMVNNLHDWENMQYRKTTEWVEKANEDMRQGYFHVMAFLAPFITESNSKFAYRYDLWDVLSMMFLGIALYKLHFLSGEKPWNIYFIMILVGYSIGLTVNYYETNLIIENDYAMTAYYKSYITYDLGRLFISIGHIGTIMVFCKSSILPWLKHSLASVGRMALTNYVMHSVFALFIFTGTGFAMFGKFQRHELMYIVFSIWIFQLIVSPIWLKYYYYGPLEWIWRMLSYRKKFPIKKIEQ